MPCRSKMPHDPDLILCDDPPPRATRPAPIPARHPPKSPSCPSRPCALVGRFHPPAASRSRVRSEACSSSPLFSTRPPNPKSFRLIPYLHLDLSIDSRVPKRHPGLGFGPGWRAYHLGFNKIEPPPSLNSFACLGRLGNRLS